jgi:hypothetical protein
MQSSSPPSVLHALPHIILLEVTIQIILAEENAVTKLLMSVYCMIKCVPVPEEERGRIMQNVQFQDS